VILDGDVVEPESLDPLRGGDQRLGGGRDEEIPESEWTVFGSWDGHSAPLSIETALVKESETNKPDCR
jgi:hypothetical protein